MEELAVSKVAKSENMECTEGQNVSLRYYKSMDHCDTRKPVTYGQVMHLSVALWDS